MLGEVKFVHSVSKGSKFNQIYIPKDMESVFEAGDMVEVRLIEKKDRIFYSKNLKDLSEFKRKIVEKVFSILGRLKEVERIFLFGSFLTSKNEYHDIDVLVISDKKLIDSKVYDILNEEFDMKFHIISIQKNKFEQLLKICPLTRSMIFYSVSNKNINDLTLYEIQKIRTPSGEPILTFRQVMAQKFDKPLILDIKSEGIADLLHNELSDKQQNYWLVNSLFPEELKRLKQLYPKLEMSLQTYQHPFRTIKTAKKNK